MEQSFVLLHWLIGHVNMLNKFCRCFNFAVSKHFTSVLILMGMLNREKFVVNLVKHVIHQTKNHPN